MKLSRNQIKIACEESCHGINKSLGVSFISTGICHELNRVPVYRTVTLLMRMRTIRAPGTPFNFFSLNAFRVSVYGQRALDKHQMCSTSDFWNKRLYAEVFQWTFACIRILNDFCLVCCFEDLLSFNVIIVFVSILIV